MPAMVQEDWRDDGAGVVDQFHFLTDEEALPAGRATADAASLTADRLIAEMAQLAEDAYDQSAKDATGRGWEAVSAAQLGMAEKGSGSVRYSFKNGVYQGDTHGSSEGQALVLSQTVDGKSILAISFRGTVDLIDQYKDYFPFDRHYEGFKPLVRAVKEFVADKANGIDKVVVTGHSLGAAMAQLFLNEKLDVPVDGYTFGSPGAEDARKKAKLLNFVHENDAVPDLGDVTGEPSGGVVTVDKVGLDGLKAAHSIEEYIETTAFLSGQAVDKDSPFHAHGLAKALRTGGDFVHDIRIEIGGDGRDTLRPFAEDRFSLAGEGDDRFDIRRSELLPEKRRDLDGGEGEDSVHLPYNRTRKGDGVIFQIDQRKDGGLALTYDVGKGHDDKWKTIGVFYRTETIVYDNGKTESLGDAATKIATAHKADVIVA